MLTENKYIYSSISSGSIPLAKTQSPRNGSLGWYQNTFSEQTHKEAQKILSAAETRRAMLIAQLIYIKDQQDISESLTEILDKIVARDPERYPAWL